MQWEAGKKSFVFKIIAFEVVAVNLPIMASILIASKCVNYKSI